MTAQEKIQKLVTQDFILQHHCNSYRAILISVGVSDRVEHYNILKKVLAERNIKFDSHYRKNDFALVTQELLNECYSYATVLQKINCVKSGFAQQRLKQYIEEQQLDTSHFKGQAWNKNNLDLERFKKGTHIKTTLARDTLVKLRGYQCEICGLSEWNDVPIPLQCHHKDSDRSNNELDNLQLLCPNCHANTTSWCGRDTNKKNVKKYVSDEKFIEALNTTNCIAHALDKLGLARSGNYKRAKKLKQQLENSKKSD